MGKDLKENVAEDGPLRPLTGDPADIAAELLRYEAAGASHLQISLEPGTVEAVEALGPMLDALDAASHN